MTCTVTCQDGLAFSGAVLPEYVCGPGTGYLWPHESPDNPRALLPACTGNRRRAGFSLSRALFRKKCGGPSLIHEYHLTEFTRHAQ